MYKQAVKMAQGAENKKVGFNLQIPNNLKAEFDYKCKQDGVTVTSMIISLMEISLAESYLNDFPKLETALFDFRIIVNSEEIYMPNPIAHNHPMYSTKVAESDFSKLMDIDIELALGIDDFRELHHLHLGSDFTYRYVTLNSLESARSYIRRISTNMDKVDAYNAAQEKYENILKEK